MPITITLDRDSHNHGKLDMELEALDNPDPQLLQIACSMMVELSQRLRHDPETCPECLAEQDQAPPEEQGTVH